MELAQAQEVPCAENLPGREARRRSARMRESSSIGCVRPSSGVPGLLFLAMAAAAFRLYYGGTAREARRHAVAIKGTIADLLPKRALSKPPGEIRYRVFILFCERHHPVEIPRTAHPDHLASSPMMIPRDVQLKQGARGERGERHRILEQPNRLCLEMPSHWRPGATVSLA